MAVRRERGSLSRWKKEGETGDNVLGMFACMTSLIHYLLEGVHIEMVTLNKHRVTPTHYPRVVKLSREGVYDKDLLHRGEAVGGMGGLGVGMGGGSGSMGAEGSTPVIMSCPLGSRTAGKAGGARGSHGGTLGNFGKRRRWQCFFNAVQKDPGLGPVPSRTSKIKTNMTFFPLATGQRGGSNARAHCTRCV